MVTIYADERLDRDLFGWEMPISWVQSINPVFIIVLAGVFAALWTRLGDREPSTPVKFALSTILMGVAFLLFLAMPAGRRHRAAARPRGDPAGLHPRRAAALAGGALGGDQAGAAKYLTQMVALFFLSVALGTAMAGQLAGYYDVDHEQPFFLWIGLASVVTGVVVLALAKPIRGLMSGVR